MRARVSEDMTANADEVFALVHDYERRLEWDTLLREAYVEGGGAAGHGVVTVCTGKWSVGGLRFRTRYVSFEPGKVAAVKLLERALFFDTWAASIRHEPLANGASRVTYTYNFRARPSWLAFLLEPIMALAFRWETRRRLRALRRALEPRARSRL